MGELSPQKIKKLDMSAGRKNEIKLNFELGQTKKLARGSSGLGVSNTQSPAIRKSYSLRNMGAAKKKNKIKFQGGNASCDSGSLDSQSINKQQFERKVAERKRIEKLNAMYIKSLEAHSQRKLLYKSLDLTRAIKNPIDGQMYAPSASGTNIS